MNNEFPLPRHCFAMPPLRQRRGIRESGEANTMQRLPFAGEGVASRSDDGVVVGRSDDGVVVGRNPYIFQPIGVTRH